MIDPECSGGYTATQIESILGNRTEDFWEWMRGQTMMICNGENCEVAHGMPIVYPWDLERYLDGRPIVD